MAQTTVEDRAQWQKMFAVRLFFSLIGITLISIALADSLLNSICLFLGVWILYVTLLFKMEFE